MYYIRVLSVLVLTSSVYSLRVEKGAQKQKDVGIIGGHNISIDKVPFVVSLRLNGTYHWCGGSIIHERFILTAAHCIVPDREYKVLVGTDKVSQGGTLYDVEKIIIHQMYSNKTNDFDICILKLNETLVFGPNVDKIALADKVKLKRGLMLNTTGWGYTQPEGTISENLQQAQVPVVLRWSCQLHIGTLVHLTRRMLCAGGHGKDSCSGDSGGPLTWKNVQVGITSFGAGCGVLPGIYTKVSNLKTWIDDVIEQNI